MGFVNQIHGGAAPSNTESVYYTGSDTLLEGYTLCYDFNAVDVTAEGVAFSTPESVFSDARRVRVEKCTEGNKIHFAGVVAANSDGVTGPGWVTIHTPGSVCSVYADADCDHERSAGAASGQLLNVTVGQYYMTDEGWPGTGAAMVLQDVDRDTVNGLVMAQLMTGPPSGGYHLIAIPSTTTDSVCTLSVLMLADPIFMGAYRFTGTSSDGHGISVMCGTAEGKYDGQRFRITSTSLLTNTVFTRDPLVISSGFIPGLGTSLALGSLIMTSGFSFAVGFSLAADHITCVYNGGRWVVEALGSTTTISNA